METMITTVMALPFTNTCTESTKQRGQKYLSTIISTMKWIVTELIGGNAMALVVLDDLFMVLLKDQ